MCIPTGVASYAPCRYNFGAEAFAFAPARAEPQLRALCEAADRESRRLRSRVARLWCCASAVRDMRVPAL
eukprot:SAG11_NODE_2052_length_3879_cov_2.030159_2_plen_70_part_00